MPRIKTIQIRTKDGWADQQNKEKYMCDVCQMKLWVAPDGKTIYCNNIHPTIYSIDRLMPNEGETCVSMVKNGNYTLEQVGQYKTLEEAILALDHFITDDANNNTLNDYDLRANDPGNNSTIIMGTINGKIKLGS